MHVRSSLANGLGSSGGAALGTLFAALARLRPTDKPLHPYGVLCEGTVSRTGANPPSGVHWLDERGEDQVLVRLSRAVGLPRPFPDIHGLALRVPVAGGRAGDLLFATTGTGSLTRFWLRPTMTGRHTHSTLLPYRTPAGPRVLAALPRPADDEFDLALAALGGAWRRFAVLRVGGLADGARPDPNVTFDPVLNTVPGLQPYPWVARLREPAYAAARRGR